VRAHAAELGNACSTSVNAGLRVPAAPSRDKHVALVAATRDGRHFPSHLLPTPRARIGVMRGSVRNVG